MLTPEEIDALAATSEAAIGYELLKPFSDAAHAEGIAEDRQKALLFVRNVLQLPLHFHSANVSHPFGRVGGTYSHEIITPDQADELGRLAPAIKTPEIRAVFSDVAWLRRKGDPALARLAVESYIESARAVQEGEHWPPVVERAERAIRLARSLGNDDPSFATASAYLEELIKTYRGEDPLFLSSHVIDLLLEFQIGAPSDYEAFARTAAERSHSSEKFHVARAYYQVLVHIARANKNNDEANKCLRELAATFVSEARARERQDNFMAAAHFLTQAIQAYKRAPDSEAYVEPLRSELQKMERASLAQFKRIQLDPIDITDEMLRARKHVSGHLAKEAMRRFIYMIKIASVADLRKQADEIAKVSIARRIAAMSHVDSEGRVIGLDSPETGPDASLGALIEQAREHRNFMVQAYIMPALDQLLLEQSFTLEDMSEWARFSPFVPEARELSFGNGLLAGFSGDFLTATHLLIPQIENSIRALLAGTGVITTKLDRFGIQRQMDLSDLLLDTRLTAILSEDLIFELRSLLIDNRGPNLRHQVAHGMLNDTAFWSAECIYVWWLTLNMCLFGPNVRPQPLAVDAAVLISGEGDSDDLAPAD